MTEREIHVNYTHVVEAIQSHLRALSMIHDNEFVSKFEYLPSISLTVGVTITKEPQ